MTREDALKSLRLKVTSGNSVPVMQASITREEYEALIGPPSMGSLTPYNTYELRH
jgi:hypothetical protein